MKVIYLTLFKIDIEAPASINSLQISYRSSSQAKCLLSIITSKIRIYRLVWFLEAN